MTPPLTRSIAGLRLILARCVREELGQGLSEYALILLFVSIVTIAALTLLGNDITSLLGSLANVL